MIRHSHILNKEKTALLIIDVQEKILKVMRNHETMISNIQKLISGFRAMSLPVLYTEQYPKGLGATDTSVKDLIADLQPVQKLTFSCFGAENLFQELRNKKIEQVVVCGIESHVCVLQTCLDLLANGFQVNLPIDAISSRKETDYNSAIMRLNSEGVIITCMETVLFELLERCDNEQFKQISKIVK